MTRPARGPLLGILGYFFLWPLYDLFFCILFCCGWLISFSRSPFGCPFFDPLHDLMTDPSCNASHTLSSCPNAVCPWGTAHTTVHNHLWLTAHSLLVMCQAFALIGDGFWELLTSSDDAMTRCVFIDAHPFPVYSCWNGMIVMDAQPFVAICPDGMGSEHTQLVL